MISSVSTGTAGTTSSTSATSTPATRPKPEDLFKKLDADDNGSIGESELQSAFVSLSPAGVSAADAAAKAKDVFSKMDSDGNGEVSEAEFKAAEPKDGGKGPGGPAGAPPTGRGAGGPPPAGGGGGAGGVSSSANKTYDAADTNQDGKVTQEEQQAYDAKQAELKAASSGKDGSGSMSVNAQEAVKTYNAVAQT